MKKRLLEFLICPACLPSENGLTCHIKEEKGDEVLAGVLRCSACSSEYHVQNGIASLVAPLSSTEPNDSQRYESQLLVSSYVWSHYADLSGDPDANTAYGEWAGLLEKQSGIALDAGCAVGRFTFEMSKKSDFVVGIDRSHAFIEKARQLMVDRQLEIALPEEGMQVQDLNIELPQEWAHHQVDFIQGDAQCLPFRSGSFSVLSSLNLVDKVPLPLAHLSEMNRVARNKNAQFLFSDPFSWSDRRSEPTHWLGGTLQGPYAGKGIDNVRRLLNGERRELGQPWNLEQQGHVWWKIRNHRNHFELIRSCFIKARR